VYFSETVPEDEAFRPEFPFHRERIKTMRALEQFAGDKAMLGRHVPSSIETGCWYDIRIELQCKSIKCYLDGKFVHDEKYSVPKPLYVVSGLSKNKVEVIIKVVNAAASAYNVELNLGGIKEVEPQYTKTVLTSDNPIKDIPKTEQLT
jgi:alpha-L-arabinofuranosidase